MSASDPPAAPSSADGGQPDRVQCSNCCRLAPITGRRMGLLFYECELCLTTGAVPDSGDRPPDQPPPRLRRSA